MKKELNTLETDALVKKEGQLKEELQDLKFKLSTQETKNTSQLKKIRKDIARIKTELRQRQGVGSGN